MKRILIVVPLLVFSLLAMAQQKKPRVAVYMTGDDPVNEIISNRLMSDLLNGGKYTPVERSAAFLQLVSKEQSYQHSGEVDDDQIAALGKQLGLEYVCVVSVVDVWQREKYITAHIIDVNSAEVVGSCSSNGTLTNSQQMISALDELSRNLTKALDYSKQSSTTKVAVYVTRSGNKDVDIILADQLVASFSKSGNYVAVERTSSFLKQLSKEVGYQQSGAVDDNDMIAELGKKFGVQYVCVAKTTFLFGVYYITARLVNVENAQVINMYNAENKVMNNSQDVLRVTQEIAERLARYSVDDEVFEVVLEEPKEERLVSHSVDGEGLEVVLEEPRAESLERNSLDEEVFLVVSEEPEFPGGIDAMLRFIEQNLVYPEVARETNIEGRVVISFVVEEDGSLSEFVKVRDIGAGCGDAVIDVLKKMPKWKPAMQQGRPIRFKYHSLPVSFTLN